MILLTNLVNNTGWKLATAVFISCLCAGALFYAGCTITTTVERKPFERKEVSPLIEQRVQQYNDSARVLSITGGVNDDVDIYVIAVKNGATLAKELIRKK